MKDIIYCDKQGGIRVLQVETLTNKWFIDAVNFPKNRNKKKYLLKNYTINYDTFYESMDYKFLIDKETVINFLVN